ncbi:MAG TPA: hypothetical protein VK137_15820, partial [Planctomycetaceae bacterium]|nr:hypothetical protein [Planctomycetaceae bacterium]
NTQPGDQPIVVRNSQQNSQHDDPLKGSSVLETFVSLCEWFPDSGVGNRKKHSTPVLLRGPMEFRFFVLDPVVSFVVILLQFPVDFRGPSHNTDASVGGSLLGRK